MGKVIYLDVETTGLNPEMHEIIEIAIIGDGIQYNKKVKPLHLETADPNALLVNGFTSADWRYAQSPETVALEVAHIIKGCTVVGHNPHFDMSFVDELLHMYGCEVCYDRRLVDTTVLAREHLSVCGLDSFSMDSIRRFFGWPYKDSHTALKDAQDCKRLYHKLLRATSVQRFIWANKKKICALLAGLKNVKNKKM